jgi:hypothetical protein
VPTIRGLLLIFGRGATAGIESLDGILDEKADGYAIADRESEGCWHCETGHVELKLTLVLQMEKRSIATREEEINR